MCIRALKPAARSGTTLDRRLEVAQRIAFNSLDGKSERFLHPRGGFTIMLQLFARSEYEQHAARLPFAAA